ncbi:MAG: hypothetical protein LBT50_08890 [Prevotellaceae bacterium]|jgi:hypothetical protein|nr:hypothetical protein [Prevotellaceae bacterium]
MICLYGNSSLYGILSAPCSGIRHDLPCGNRRIKYVYAGIKMVFPEKNSLLKTKKNQIISTKSLLTVAQKYLARYFSYILKVSTCFFTGRNLSIYHPKSFKQNILNIQNRINLHRTLFRNWEKRFAGLQTHFKFCGKPRVALQTPFRKCGNLRVALQTPFRICGKPRVALQTPFRKCGKPRVALQTPFRKCGRPRVALQTPFRKCGRSRVALQTLVRKVGMKLDRLHSFTSMKYIMIGNREIHLFNNNINI